MDRLIAHSYKKANVDMTKEGFFGLQQTKDNFKTISSSTYYTHLLIPYLSGGYNLIMTLKKYNISLLGLR
ncbi:hypothetical protein M5K25_003638 [Dendrobium thyrsiflorum]|uniref:Uncharacterized protein n=1 Tax=Dendrobium thyrsiflorum TaxID=117978 RepID=A0ABD0VRK0_DENTH